MYAFRGHKNFMKKGLALVVIAGLMWGTSCVFVHLLKPFSFSSLQITAIRFSTALVWMLLYCAVFRRDAFKINVKDLYLFALGGMTLYGAAALYYLAMQLTSPSTAVVLMYIAPVPIMIFSVLFFGEKFNLKKGIAVVLMIAGCTLVSGIFGDFKPNVVGIILGLTSALVYATYCIFNKICAMRSIGSFTFMLYVFIFATAFSMLLCNVWEFPELIAQSPATIIPIGLLHGLMTCMLPFLFYTISLNHLSSGVASSLSIIEPVTGAVLGFLFYDDNLTFFSIIGIVLVISSVILLGLCEMERDSKAITFKNVSQ